MVKTKQLIVKIPQDTKVTLKGDVVHIEGPKGSLSQVIDKAVNVALEDSRLVVRVKKEDTKTRAMHGLVRALISNAIKGVTVGFTKTLELSGVGFRAQVEGDELTLSVGFSHPVKVKALPGITFTVAENKITVSGIDKQIVGQIAHTIRSARPPEPYKGKGIRYEGERIRRKAGKAAVKAVGIK